LIESPRCLTSNGTPLSIHKFNLTIQLLFALSLHQLSWHLIDRGANGSVFGWAAELQIFLIAILNPDVSWIACCDHGYGRPSGRPRSLAPATYRSDTPRNQSRGTAGRLSGMRRKRLRCAWHANLRSLATSIHETSGLKFFRRMFIPEIY
jgi:hypothetical protein